MRDTTPVRLAVALGLGAACYQPVASPGAPCGSEGQCPPGLVCANATRTCERTDSVAIDTAMPIDEPPSRPLRVTPVKHQETTVGTTVTVTVDQPIAAGTLVVAELAARGDPPVTITDTRNNTWLLAAQTANSSNVTVAAIYYAVLTADIGSGDAVTATVTGATQLRSLGLFIAEGATALGQTGVAMVTGATQSVTTTGPLSSPNELLFGVIATGLNTAVTFTPAAGFVEFHEYSSGFSSGSLNHGQAAGVAGPQTFAVTPSLAQCNSAIVIATFR